MLALYEVRIIESNVAITTTSKIEICGSCKDKMIKYMEKEKE